ncbi:hypothetical protein QBC34DRAFT_156503 [Podospora aff. communis PSN243]|uniref:Uncharacterized protein n=1 Tax=Podospora aff. communis PSN243 TaxID=3040156 RepID=A0AAV9H2U5_9PEZI|nr:hypothetical protein QBC34DRAFT_156503 [Podospora aff. communis PSN243]
MQPSCNVGRRRGESGKGSQEWRYMCIRSCVRLTPPYISQTAVGQLRDTRDAGEPVLKVLSCPLRWSHGSEMGAIGTIGAFAFIAADDPFTVCLGHSPDPLPSSGDAAIGALVGNQRPGRRCTPIEIRNRRPPNSHGDVVGWVFVITHGYLACCCAAVLLIPLELQPRSQSALSPLYFCVFLLVFQEHPDQCFYRRNAGD